MRQTFEDTGGESVENSNREQRRANQLDRIWVHMGTDVAEPARRPDLHESCRTGLCEHPFPELYRTRNTI